MPQDQMATAPSAPMSSRGMWNAACLNGNTGTMFLMGLLSGLACLSAIVLVTLVWAIVAGKDLPFLAKAVKADIAPTVAQQ